MKKNCDPQFRVMPFSQKDPMTPSQRRKLRRHNLITLRSRIQKGEEAGRTPSHSIDSLYHL